jgi:hypothetical protein
MSDPNFRKNILTLLSVISVSGSILAIGLGLVFFGWLPEWSFTKKFLSLLLLLIFLYAAGAMAVLSSRAQVDILGGEGSKLLGTAVLIAVIAGFVSVICIVLIVFRFLASTL